MEHEFAGGRGGVEAFLEADQVDTAGLEAVNGLGSSPIDSHPVSSRQCGVRCRNGERDAVEVFHGHCEVEESAHPVAQGKGPVCNPIWRTFHLERTTHHCVTLH